MATVVQVIACFEASPKGLRCSDVRAALEGLQFNIREARAGHRVVTHPGLRGFQAASFNCGHGRNGVVLPVYVRRLAKLLLERKEELEALNGE